MIQLIIGGARSGKSRYAQEQALIMSSSPVYVATARVWDNDFQRRITRHQQERSSAWSNHESEKYIHELPLAGRIVVIDCVTLWLTNFFVDHHQDIDAALREFITEIDKLKQIEATFLIITNEIGMGLHADTETGRKFVDLQGWANQYIASQATDVVFMVSGIPWKIK